MPKKKNYEVTIIASTVVAVKDAESKEQAIEFAQEEISTSDWDVDEMKAVEARDDDDWDAIQRHANLKT